jgi:hypothetical protein
LNGHDPAYAGVRFDPEAPKPHVESWFLKANDPVRRRALWLKSTIFAGHHDPSAAVAEAWAVAFDDGAGRGHHHVAVKTQVPIATARFARDRLDVAVDETTLTQERARGRVSSGGRTIAWDLALQSSGPPLLHFPKPWMYEGPLPSSKLVSPMVDARVTGTIDVGDERWEASAWPALVGHNWGRGHAHLYAWGHCNAWTDDAETVFEGLSAKIKLGPVTTPMATLLFVRHRGVRYDLNALSQLVKNRGEVSLRRWRFRGDGRLVRIEGEMWADTDDFVGLFYPNPDGTMTHCLNSKLAHARVEITLRGRTPMVLASERAALEIGTHDAAHGVRMYV